MLRHYKKKVKCKFLMRAAMINGTWKYHTICFYFTEVRPSSHTTTLYDNGKYQSLSYQNDYSIGSNKKSKSTTLESGSDPLSQSLPAKNLKKMKKSKSVENSSVKCVYDSRLFKMDEADDTEYLKAKRQDNNSFKDFLNASFNNERKTSKVSEKKKSINLNF